MVGCFQAVVGKNMLLYKFEDYQKRYMSASSLSYLCETEEFGQEVDETILDLPKGG